jgi:beta-N-acetylglucosaminidase
MKKDLLFLIVIVFSMFSFMNVFASENGKVIGDFVSVRAKASSSSTIIIKLLYGTDVTIVGEEGSFYKVIYDGINTGYMSKEYVYKDSDYKLDDPAYCKTLTDAGFPESYCPYLSYIHSIHPNWTFTAKKIDATFDEVVSNEENKNCLASTNTSYVSTDTVCDAGGYYFVNQTVNAYFLDPRNFLLEKTIFMFENLTYNEVTSSRANVTSILGSDSFIVTDKDTDGTSYLDYYLDAGKTYNVSSVHLASRTKQEGASVSTYGPVTGTVTSTLEEYGNRTLYGYYNFYNIGATNGSYPQLRGLAYAAGYNRTSTVISTSFGRPWDSRKKAIYGGASYISSGYISNGQYTLYFQKFNTNKGESTNTLYAHQYMSNILSPYSEGHSVKKTYAENGALGLDYNFVIPVYNNMPDSTSQAGSLSKDNSAASINIDGNLISGFDTDILEYTIYFVDTKTEVSVTATANSSSATIEGTGVIKLPNEDNVVTIKVTAQSGDVRTYTINIKRVKDTTTVEEVIQKLGVKNKDSYLYGMSAGTDSSTIIASVQKISPTAEITVMDANGNKKSGALVTGDKVVIKTLTSASTTFEIAINGDVNGDGVVDIKDLLRVQKHLLGTVNLSGVTSVAADDNYDGKINVQDLLRIQKSILGSMTL